MTDKTDIAALKRPVRERHDWSMAIWRDCDHCGKEHTGTVTTKDGSSICARCVDEKYWSAWENLAESALGQLEVERQRADGLEAAALAMRDDMRVAREELAELRGVQEPDHYHLHTPATGANIYYPASQKQIVEAIKDDLSDDVVVTPLFTRQAKPVVVLPDPHYATSQAGHPVMINSLDGHWLNKTAMTEVLLAAGIVVKDGE